MHSLKYQSNKIALSIITSYKYFQYFTKSTIFSKMHSRECIIARMHSQNRGSKHNLSTLASLSLDKTWFNFDLKMTWEIVLDKGIMESNST